MFEGFSHLLKKSFLFFFLTLFLIFYVIFVNSSLFIKISQLQIKLFLVITNATRNFNIYDTIMISSLCLVWGQLCHTFIWNFNSSSQLNSFWYYNFFLRIDCFYFHFSPQHSIIYIYIVLCKYIIVVSFEYAIFCDS